MTLQATYMKYEANNAYCGELFIINCVVVIDDAKV
jgi:hypothetical protein